jgi:hypothetical protein
VCVTAPGHDEIQMIKIAAGSPTPKAPPTMSRKSESQIALGSRADMPSLHKHTGEQATGLNEEDWMFERADKTRCSNHGLKLDHIG